MWFYTSKFNLPSHSCFESSLVCFRSNHGKREYWKSTLIGTDSISICATCYKRFFKIFSRTSHEKVFKWSNFVFTKFVARTLFLNVGCICCKALYREPANFIALKNLQELLHHSTQCHVAMKENVHSFHITVPVSVLLVQFYT